jgi:hypothetical protein
MTKKKVDIIPDALNANKHSEYGMRLLESSMRKFGFVEAGVISEDGVICGGNARNEVAEDIGITEKEIIEIDRTKQVYLMPKGLKSGTKEFHELALALNSVPKANITWDNEAIEKIQEDWDIKPEEWGVKDFDGVNLNPDDLGTDFTLPSGDKAPFQQMTFTLADQQAILIQNAIADIKKTEEYKFIETMGNENSNGNALYLIVSQWAGQRT